MDLQLILGLCYANLISFIANGNNNHIRFQVASLPIIRNVIGKLATPGSIHRLDTMHSQ